MIKKLKQRFIILAMAALTILMVLIVAGMNTANYRQVISDADTRLEVLEQISDRLFDEPESRGPGSRMLMPFGDSDALEDGAVDNEEMEEFFGRRGRGGHSMSRDEAEESRFFTVNVSSSGQIEGSNISRIAAVDSEEAAAYAEQALSSGKDKGFVGEFRYIVSEDAVSGSRTITFLDCGRVLGAFRDYLRYSILMSVAGLAAMFALIYYFAGRIVRPVAESYDKQKRFITDAGHEIKTPLAIIKANLDLMDMEIEREVGAKSMNRNTSEEIASSLKDSLGDISDQVERLAELTNDLVYLSRMEESGGTLVMSELPLSDIVSETAESFKPLAADRGKDIAMDIEPMISVQGSSKELEKLVSILMENAIKYSSEPRHIELKEDECGMPAPPLISVELRKDGKNAVLEICNPTESEITNESLAHVFDRFYRADESRNSGTGGHGIGLSVAQAIVNAHKGKISAFTQFGRDFHISASIPLA